MMTSILSIVITLTALTGGSSPPRPPYCDVAIVDAGRARIRYDAVFTGELVSMTAPKVPPYGSKADELTFVVEKRWRGPSGDTIHVSASTCGFFSVGRRYLVRARTKDYRLVIEEGDEWSYTLFHSAIETRHADSLMSLLGPAKWEAKSRDRSPFNRLQKRSKDLPVLDVTISVVGAQCITASITNGAQLQTVCGRGVTLLRFQGLTNGMIYELHVKPKGGVEEVHFIQVRCYPGGFSCGQLLYLDARPQY